MSDPPSGDISFYMILVGIGALVTVCGCAACAFILSHQHRKRKKQQAIPPEEGINNQREFVNLIRNVDRPVPSLSPATTLMQPTTPVPVSRCYEEIELTLPPSPAPSHPSPALKPVHAPKLDISNRDREKLNRFHYTDNQELEVWLDTFEVLLLRIFYIFFCTLWLAGPCVQALNHSCSFENEETFWPLCAQMAIGRHLRSTGC